MRFRIFFPRSHEESFVEFVEEYEVAFSFGQSFFNPNFFIGNPRVDAIVTARIVVEEHEIANKFAVNNPNGELVGAIGFEVFSVNSLDERFLRFFQLQDFAWKHFFSFVLFKCLSDFLGFFGLRSVFDECAFGKKSIHEESMFAKVGVRVDPEFVNRDKRKMSMMVALHEVFIQVLSNFPSIHEPHGYVVYLSYILDVIGIGALCVHRVFCLCVTFSCALSVYATFSFHSTSALYVLCEEHIFRRAYVFLTCRGFCFRMRNRSLQVCE